jgi:hypothetical protein
MGFERNEVLPLVGERLRVRVTGLDSMPPSMTGGRGWMGLFGDPEGVLLEDVLT